MQRSQSYQSSPSEHLGAWNPHIVTSTVDKLLVLLLTIDLLSNITHIWWWTTLVFTGVQRDPNFSITHEGGYSERYQFAKEFWIILLCGLLAIRQRTWSFCIWALFFSYVLYDDSRAVHEHTGGRIAVYVPDLAFPGAVSVQDIGELAVFLAVGLIFMPLLALAYWRSAPPLRTIHRRMFLLVSILVCLAAGADLVHRLYEPLWWDLLFGVIEDGGELMIMSVILWYVFKLSVQHPLPHGPSSAVLR